MELLVQSLEIFSTFLPQPSKLFPTTFLIFFLKKTVLKKFCMFS